MDLCLALALNLVWIGREMREELRAKQTVKQMNKLHCNIDYYYYYYY